MIDSDNAKEILRSIQTGGSNVVALLRLLYEEQAWEVLGYKSFTTMVNSEIVHRHRTTIWRAVQVVEVEGYLRSLGYLMPHETLPIRSIKPLRSILNKKEDVRHALLLSRNMDPIGRIIPALLNLACIEIAERRRASLLEAVTLTDEEMVRLVKNRILLQPIASSHTYIEDQSEMMIILAEDEAGTGQEYVITLDRSKLAKIVNLMQKTGWLKQEHWFSTKEEL